MQIPFFKYHGAGNDFICIDDRNNQFNFLENKNNIQALCTRHLGIGADGLIFLRQTDSISQMHYYNSDGAASSFCGNGSRCFIHFCHHLGIIQHDEFQFMSSDGAHFGTFFNQNKIQVSLNLGSELTRLSESADFIDTGSPHYIDWHQNLPKGDIVSIAREIRYSKPFSEKGVNVNFVSENKDYIYIRTYERGVEDETLACGTGITAAAISYANRKQLTGEIKVQIKALGGYLQVDFNKDKAGHITKLRLTGPARMVYTGSFDYATLG